MKAMVFTELGKPLLLQEKDRPKAGEGQVVIHVHTCGVCRTDLHIIEGDLKPPKLPLILGHQIVGTIVELGEKVTSYHLNQRVGVAWLQKSCGLCEYCKRGDENLCERAIFTGYHVDGGYAEYTLVDASALYLLPDHYNDLHLAPLLCGGLIGFRAYRMLTGAKNIGFYGFGSSAHILAQVVQSEGGKVYAFTRDDDFEKQAFAKSLGAIWAGGSSEKAPILLDGALIFAPSGPLFIEALKNVKKGGWVISTGIHMSPIPSFPYELLWGERKIGSVSNLTHKDGIEFLKIANKISIHTEVTSYPLEKANEALEALRLGHVFGSIVLKIHS